MLHNFKHFIVDNIKLQQHGSEYKFVTYFHERYISGVKEPDNVTPVVRRRGVYFIVINVKGLEDSCIKRNHHSRGFDPI